MDDSIIINRIDRLDRLHSLVRKDLKDLGIKLPKLKSLKKISQARSISQDDGNSSRIFGEPLYQVPGTFILKYGYVPQFLTDAAKVVDKCIENEGLFRKSGSISRQKELQLNIEEGNPFEAANIYDVTVLIKQFFRELPEPIFVTVYHESFIKCFSLSADKDPKRALLEMCLLLPLENIGALRFTLHMLHRVASNCDKNKMTFNNLALVMAPNLLHFNKGTEKMSSGEEKLLRVHTCIIEVLIKNWELVGMVSADLRQQLNMMSECFGADDDPVFSDDNTLEDAKDVLRRKKRKRSGSLTGFVSSIAQGIAKLRRSTDGKGIHGSISSTSNGSSREELSMDTNQTLELLADSAVTPCVMRKRQTCDNTMPFSAAKKKAILGNLPQKSALASTPFTPASTVKKGQPPYLSSAMRTVSLNSTTPALGTKTSRKKLNLFSSPSNNKNVKRQNSACARMQSPPTLEKSGKSKNFFRRLSASRSGKHTSRDTSTSSVATEREERCANTVILSPKSFNLDSTAYDMKNSVTGSQSSPALHDPELSIVIVDDQVPMDSGFVDDAGALINTLNRQECIPDSVGLTKCHGPGGVGPKVQCPGRSKYKDSPDLKKQHGNADKLHLLNRNSSPPRLQCKPATSGIEVDMTHTPVAAGTNVLKGNTGLRRSRKDEFEREKNDRKREGGDNKLGVDADLLITDPTSSNECGHLEDTCNTEKSPAVQLDTSLLGTILSPPQGFGDISTNQDEEDEEIDVGSDQISVSGFSTISGGTVMRRTESGSYLGHRSHTTSGTSIASFISYDSVLKPSMKLQLQSAVSTDSLFSVESTLSDQSGMSVPKLNRCTSSDSGKGSLLGESVCSYGSGKYDNTFMTKSTKSTAPVDLGSDFITLRCNKDSRNGESYRGKSTLLTCKGMKMSEKDLSVSRSSSSCPLESSSDSTRIEGHGSSLSICSKQELDDLSDRANIHRRRSISAEHLGFQVAPRASMRARSNSIHISPGKKFNYKPHLEITRETHNLLARAGYFKPTEDNSNSKYVHVDVKSPKRSSHREEMMWSLRSSFRDKHNYTSTSIRSASYKFDTSDMDITASREESSCGNAEGREKLSLSHHMTNDKELENDLTDQGQIKNAIHNICTLECLDPVHKIAEIATNIEELTGQESSSCPVDESEKIVTGSTSNDIIETEFVENIHHFTKDESDVDRHDLQVNMPVQKCRVLKCLKDSDKALTLSGILDKEIASQVKIKRAQVMLPRHGSIVNIQQAGLVTHSVRQLAESQSGDQLCQFAMPFVAKRGTSLVRIPSIFAHGQDKQTAELMRERTGSKDVMKLFPVPSTDDKRSASLMIQGLSSNASVDDIQESSKMDSDAVITSSTAHSHHENISNHMAVMNGTCHISKSSPYRGKQSDCSTSMYLKEVNFELSESLMETITDACTPRSTKHRNKGHETRCQIKSPLSESTNTDHTSSKEITESARLRPPNGPTPSRILIQKGAGSQTRQKTQMRNNLHHVKRLHTHNSPRKVRSPKSRTSSMCGGVASPSNTLQMLTVTDMHIKDGKQ